MFFDRASGMFLVSPVGSRCNPDVPQKEFLKILEYSSMLGPLVIETPMLKLEGLQDMWFGSVGA